MSRLKLEDTVANIILKMSEGNPGALRVLMKMLRKEDGIIYVFTLDDMGIYGSQIWVGYKDHCGQDIDKFIESIKKREV